MFPFNFLIYIYCFKIAIIGDFNATVRTTFEEELLELCTKDELIISDYDKYGCTFNQFTYISDVHSTTSWLDHIICSFDFCSLASDVVILDKLHSSDHLPCCCRIRFELVFDIESRDSCDGDVKVNPMHYSGLKLLMLRLNSIA